MKYAILAIFLACGLTSSASAEDTLSEKPDRFLTGFGPTIFDTLQKAQLAHTNTEAIISGMVKACNVRQPVETPRRARFHLDCTDTQGQLLARIDIQIAFRKTAIKTQYAENECSYITRSQQPDGAVSLDVVCNYNHKNVRAVAVLQGIQLF